MTSDVSPNRRTLLSVAETIRPLLDEVVFVGGQVAELLITAPEAVRVRPTKDVDIVVQATTRIEYNRIEERIRDLGLVHDTSDGAPICRWRTEAGYLLDLLPERGEILGFASQWYPETIRTATSFALRDDLVIRIADGPRFLASKWDAFRDRGDGDVLGSHDLEDIILVIAGRPAIVDEISAAGEELAAWLALRSSDLLKHELASYAIRGALPDAVLIPELFDEVLGRFREIAELIR